MNSTKFKKATDEELMQQAAGCDGADAFKEIAQRHRSKIVGRIKRLVSNSRHPAEDLCQETFLRLWLARKRFRVDHSGKLLYYLFTIARNCCFLAIRREKRHRQPRIFSQLEEGESKYLIPSRDLCNKSLKKPRADKVSDKCRICGMVRSGKHDKYCERCIAVVAEHLTAEELDVWQQKEQKRMDATRCPKEDHGVWGVEPIGMTSSGMEYRVVKFSCKLMRQFWMRKNPKKRKPARKVVLHTYLRDQIRGQDISFGQSARVRDSKGREA